MVRLKQYLKVPQSLISLCSIFLGHPVVVSYHHPGEQHHSDELQAVPVREVPRRGDEARAGGRHPEEEAGGEEETGDTGGLSVSYGITHDVDQLFFFFYPTFHTQELQHEVMPRNGVQQLLHAQQVTF